MKVIRHTDMKFVEDRKLNLVFLLIWLSFGMQLSILTILKPFFTDFESVALISILIHVLFTYIIFLGFGKKNKIVLIFFGAFIIRVLAMLWDFYATSIFILPHSGADSEMFFRFSLEIANNITLLGESIRGGIYSKINGVLFYLIGPQRLIGQYINVLLGVMVVFFLYKSLNLLQISQRTIIIICLIASFFPNSIIMSAIFLREIFPTFFVAVSLYYFLKWYKFGVTTSIIFSFIAVGLASTFHSGLIGILIGFAFILLFYKRRGNRYKFSINTIFIFSILVILTILIFTQFNGVLLGKFGDVEGIGDIYEKSNTRLGESVYLTGITINNPFEFAIFGPLKALYFLISPIPLDWRGILDVFSFFTDSSLYLGTMFFIFVNRKRLGENKTLIIGLISILISVALIFGIGVGNAGTAMRHRQKISVLFLIILSLVMESKKRPKK